MTAHVRVAHGISQLPESLWRGLVAERPALRLEVLRAIEHTATRPLPLQTFLLEDETGIAAAAVCESIKTPGEHNPLDALLFGRAAHLARWFGVSTEPVLLFKSPIGRESSIALRPADPAAQQQTLGRLLDAIEEHAAQHKLGIAFIDVAAEGAHLGCALRARHYIESQLDAMARMEIAWSNFDGYIDSLRRQSKNAAHNARRERNCNRRNGVTIRQVPLGAADAGDLFEITRDHFWQKNGKYPLYGPRFLPLLAELLGDDLLVFEAIRESRRIGMLAAVRSGSVGWMAWIGIESRDRPNDFTYANLNFYHAADWAPALGLKTLLYGTGVLDTKLRRGCQLSDCRLFYRPHRAISRAIAKPYLSIHQAWFRRKSR